MKYYSVTGNVHNDGLNDYMIGIHALSWYIKLYAVSLR